jgi:hypothetical protein
MVSAAIRLLSFVYEIKIEKTKRCYNMEISHFIIDGIANYIHCKKNV